MGVGDGLYPESLGGVMHEINYPVHGRRTEAWDNVEQLLQF